MHSKTQGFSLIELMVAMTIGIILVGGALTVHIQSYDAHTFAERMARIQENGRFAFDTISPDLRLAGFWGRTEFASAISRRTGDTATPMPAAMRPANDCYVGYYTNVVRRVEAANGDQVGAANPFQTCLPDSARLAGTDILVVRHASATVTPRASLINGRLYIISNAMTGSLFVGGLMPVPAGFLLTDTIHEVITNAYYVSPNSSAGVGIPALNRLELADGPALVNLEMIAGVEDLQVQLGIDTNGDGSVNSYVTPGSAALVGARIVANRAWIRVRGERIDLDHTDTATYDYADLSVAPDDSFRRILISKTLRFRNGLGS